MVKDRRSRLESFIRNACFLGGMGAVAVGLWNFDWRVALVVVGTVFAGISYFGMIANVSRSTNRRA